MTDNSKQINSFDADTYIKNAVESDAVVLFMKGIPDVPQCGFSSLVVRMLDHLGVAYSAVNVLDNDDIRQGIKTYSEWPTVPQLYVRSEFVGGCDIVRDMFENGELRQLLTEKGVPFSK